MVLANARSVSPTSCLSTSGLGSGAAQAASSRTARTGVRRMADLRMWVARSGDARRGGQVAGGGRENVPDTPARTGTKSRSWPLKAFLLRCGNLLGNCVPVLCYFRNTVAAGRPGRNAMKTELDSLDVRILEQLQRDATTPVADIADKVESSKTVV
ncbi:MAG: AsnC family transcriptional regulator, partial [Nevskiaceae bacterium]